MNNPTQSELSMIMARIATGEERTVDEYHRLAERALHLWEGAGWALTICTEHREVREKGRAHAIATFRRAGLEPPEIGQGFTFDRALHFLMSQKRTEDRNKAVRDYLKAEARRDPLAFIRSAEEAELTPDDRATNQMEWLREQGFNYGQFCRFAESFLPWLENDKSGKRSTAGKTGGRKAKKPATKKKSKG